jgi:hypothetical protein
MRAAIRSPLASIGSCWEASRKLLEMVIGNPGEKPPKSTGALVAIRSGEAVLFASLLLFS